MRRPRGRVELARLRLPLPPAGRPRERPAGEGLGQAEAAGEGGVRPLVRGDAARRDGPFRPEPRRLPRGGLAPVLAVVLLVVIVNAARQDPREKEG